MNSFLHSELYYKMATTEEPEAEVLRLVYEKVREYVLLMTSIIAYVIKMQRESLERYNESYAKWHDVRTLSRKPRYITD